MALGKGCGQFAVEHRRDVVLGAGDDEGGDADGGQPGAGVEVVGGLHQGRDVGGEGVVPDRLGEGLGELGPGLAGRVDDHRPHVALDDAGLKLPGQPEDLARHGRGEAQAQVADRRLRAERGEGVEQGEGADSVPGHPGRVQDDGAAVGPAGEVGALDGQQVQEFDHVLRGSLHRHLGARGEPAAVVPAQVRPDDPEALRGQAGGVVRPVLGRAVAAVQQDDRLGPVAVEVVRDLRPVRSVHDGVRDGSSAARGHGGESLPAMVKRFSFESVQGES